MNIGIYIYPDAEVLDFSGPFEVFSTASRLSTPKDIFNVFLVAENKAPVLARAGYSVNPHYNFSNHPPIGVLIVVGGVHSRELEKPTVLNWIAGIEKQATLVASVCTGAFILTKAGVLSNQNVTTHWEHIDDLRKAYPDLKVIDSKRWVEDEKFITSGGISAGIDMSLYLVSRLAGTELAERTARQMEYKWHKNV